MVALFYTLDVEYYSTPHRKPKRSRKNTEQY